MKKLRTSFIVKLIAWMLIAISGMGLVAGGAAAVFMENQGMYHRSFEEIKEEHYDRYSDRYSALVLDHYLNNKESGIEYFADKNFKYGIIHANSEVELKGLDLSKPETFLESNFEGEVPKFDELHVFQCAVDDETYFDYYNPESLFGHYWINNLGNYWNTYEIDDFVYDLASGIFYCEANGKLYPVPNILLHLYDENSYEAVSLTYDSEQDGYQAEIGSNFKMPVDTSGNIGVLELYDYDVDVEAYTQLITKEQTFNFSMVEEAGINGASWEEATINTYHGRDWANALKGESEWVEVEFRYEDYQNNENERWTIKDREVFIEATGFVTIKPQNNSSANYYVVSYVDSFLVTNGEEWIYGDLFVKFEYLYRSLYEFRYEAIGIALGCLLVYVMVFVWLCCMAGYRKGQEGLSEKAINKVPLEIYGAVTITVEVVGLLLLENVIFYGSYMNMMFNISVAAGLTLILGLLLTAMALEVVTRIKLGTLWKRTICAWIIGKIFGGGKDCLMFIRQNLSLVVRVALGSIILFAIDFILIALINGGEGFALLLLLMGRVVLLFVVIAVAYWLSKLKVAGEHVAVGDLEYKVDTTKMFWDFKQHGDNLNSIGDGLSLAVEERMKSEHFKTELITNVSHDIKTPLTSIINYVDLLQKEEIENEHVAEYLEVLERQSARLKKLLDDLMEASKASTGTLPVTFEVLEAGVFMVQTVGEFEEKTNAQQLELIIKKPEEPIYIKADGRHFWRVIDNLMNNICKYAQPGTRVYINLEATDKEVYITFRNTSRYELNITSEELMERFVRGDSSRNTEGSGLGLSIAQSLIELMGGRFELVVDGDLFKVILTFARH